MVMDKLQPVIDKAVSSYAGPQASSTIKYRARLLTADALKKFDPSTGAALSSYVYGNLRQLQQLAPKINDPLPVPEQMRRDRGAVLRTTQELQDHLGREPDDSEVADLAGLTLKRVQKVRRMARRGIPLSVLDSANEDEEESDGANSIIGSIHTPEDDWLEAVDHDLHPIDRKILRYRTGYDSHPILPNHEIAKLLGMSAPAITQRAAKIQAQLEAFDA